MEGLGYGPDKPLKIKVSTRNIAIYRDPAVILIDQLKKIYIEGELEPIDTTVWYAKVQRKDYSVGMNITGVGVDDPDVNLLRELLPATPSATTRSYCNPEVDKLIDQQSAETDREKRKKLVWEIEKKLAEDVARPIIDYDVAATCWHPQRQGARAAAEQHLQQLALRRRLARQVAPPSDAASDQREVARGRLSRPRASC